jgi:hypothetical protein
VLKTVKKWMPKHMDCDSGGYYGLLVEVTQAFIGFSALRNAAEFREFKFNDNL